VPNNNNNDELRKSSKGTQYRSMLRAYDIS